jgi:hypothetical protein
MHQRRISGRIVPMIARRSTLVLLLGVDACATPGRSGEPGEAAPARIQALRIVARDASVCPGDIIVSRYEATGADGKVVSLARSQLSLLTRTAIEAEPRANGDWKTTDHALASIVSGFALKAVLTSDTTVRAEATVAPKYGCVTNTFSLRTPQRGAPVSAHVRLGVFRTPFYDSVVVGALEVEGQPPRIFVLGPKDIRAGAIRIDASGSPGAAGQNGLAGRDGGVCENGERGGDGDEGQPGSSGGHVNIIMEAGAPWLEELVAVSNPGGPGGPGGTAGSGGRAGPTQPTGTSSRCSTSPGQRGTNGRAGQAGNPGPLPQATTVPIPLLWSGSPLWSDSTARRALTELMAAKK